MARRGKSDGKGVDGAVAWEKELKQFGKALKDVDSLHVHLSKSDAYIHQIKFVSKSDDGDDWLVIISVDTDNGPQIAFHGAFSFSEAVKGLTARINNGTLKWRDDEYRKS